MTHMVSGFHLSPLHMIFVPHKVRTAALERPQITLPLPQSSIVNASDRTRKTALD